MHKVILNLIYVGRIDRTIDMNSILQFREELIKLSGLDFIKCVVNFTFCSHYFIAKRKQNERNGTHNAQCNTEATERNRSGSKAKTSKTSKDIKTLTNILNGIKSKNLDEEYKVG